MNTSKPPPFLWIYTLPALGLILLGSVVMVGWFTHDLRLVQINPAFIPMQFNTAFCFLLLGIGSWSIARRLTWLNVLIGTFLAIASLATLLQYSLGLDFGIDQLLFSRRVDPQTDFPGRMSFNTAVGFFLSSFVLLCASFNERGLPRALSMLASALIVSVAGIAIFRYLLGLETGTLWAELTKMSFLTAFGFSLFGSIALLYDIVLSLWLKKLEVTVPVSIALIFLLLSLGIVQILETQEQLRNEQSSREMTDYLKQKIEESFNYNVTALQRLAERHTVYQKLPLSYWEEQVEKHTSDFPYFTKVSVVENEQPEINPSTAVLSINNHDGTLTLSVPSTEDPKKKVVARFNLSDFMEESIMKSKGYKDFRISIFDEKRSLLVMVDSGKLPIHPKSSESPVHLGTLNFTLQIYHYKTTTWLDSNKKSVLLGSLGLLTVLATLIVYFGQLLYREKRQLEEAVSKLEEANKAKSSFLANMSHEIRTPLNGIIGSSSLMLLTSLNEKQKKYSKRIESCGNILLNLLNDILDFSKIEAGELKLEAIPVELYPLVREITDYTKEMAEEKKLEFAVRYPEELELTIISDPLRLKQILQNLINNAIKFTERGTVTLSLAPLKLTAEEAEILFEVKDTGIGISPENLSLLFSKFSQVDVSMTRKFGGTGLGLSISKELVEMLGGKIGVESTLGKGSTFWFSLPFKLAHAEKEPPHPHPQKERHHLLGARILIVDDDQVNRQIIKEYLSTWGVDVVSAASPSEALALYENEGPFDLLLVDYRMPEMNGAEFVKRTKNTPAIILSSESESGLLENEQIAALLVKPIYPFDLYHQIANILHVKE